MFMIKLALLPKTRFVHLATMERQKGALCPA